MLVILGARPHDLSLEEDCREFWCSFFQMEVVESKINDY